jgi:hypothetical protein
MNILDTGWAIPFGLLTIGTVLGYCALALLGEYRKVFFANPRSVMSFDVWSQLLFHPAATPAYLGVFMLFIALWFIALGFFVLVSMVGFTIVELAYRLFPDVFGRA